jgi:hypothetical protein
VAVLPPGVDGGLADPPDEPDAGPCDTDTDGDGRGPGCPAGPDCAPDDEELFDERELYVDADGDGVGVIVSETVCVGDELPAGYVADRPEAGDCDDDDPSVAPGFDEVCDATDNDCDGTADEEGCPCTVEHPPGEPEHPYLFCELPLSWHDARGFCLRQPGYDLVSIGDVGEHDWWRVAARDLSTEDWWIGFTDEQVEGSFGWTDLTSPDFTAWNSGEPNNSNGVEHCAELVDDTSWNDVVCRTMNYFSCEGLPARRPAAETCGTDDDGDGRGVGCPLGPDCDDDDDEAWRVHTGWPNRDGDAETSEVPLAVCAGAERPATLALERDGDDCDDWDPGRTDSCDCARERRDGREYRLCRDNRTWGDALNTCRGLGDGWDFAAPQTEAEDAWLRAQVFFHGGAGWIGLDDTGAEGEWVWIDDTPAPNWGWGPGEPNGGGSENCANLHDYGWVDRDCGNTRDYICEGPVP